jgi:hypothetical protein
LAAATAIPEYLAVLMARATTRALGGRARWTGRARGGVARGGVECASRARREGESSSSPLGDGFTKARDARDGAL